MQYHLNGYRSGSPDVRPDVNGGDGQAESVDVLIVGCGPAGLTLAAQLAAFPDIATRIVDQKPGPLTVGQADGIACRSMEMFEAFGFAHKVRREAYWVNEISFWRPVSGQPGISRTGRMRDVEEGLSEQPHTILNQARVHDFLLEIMQNGSRRLTPQYNRKLLSLRRDDTEAYPVAAQFRVTENGESRVENLRARYVVGCDGARSTVRKSLGLKLIGESAHQLWGVMDILAVTDFPDIRLKCAVQSAAQGSLLIIPREGGYMVRMYIELDALVGTERVADRNLTPEALIEKARKILAPYTLDVKEVAWWSAYEIGQRVCDQFDDAGADLLDPHIFIAGDACHTHSPKAGQGMNVSMADTFNLGWKLASVLRGQATPALLRTYSAERQAKAKELIDFDREMAHTFSTTQDTDVFQRYFAKHARYTAGVETRYDPSSIIAEETYQELSTGFRIGMRFHSAPVIRMADAKPLELAHALIADGRWRVVIFAGNGDIGQPGGALATLAEFLQTDPSSPLCRYTPKGHDIDALVDVRAVLQANHREVTITQMPRLLHPAKGRYGLTDYEKVFCHDPHAGDIYDMRGIDRARGAMVVVRPDQYIAQVLPLAETRALSAFFDSFLIATQEK